MDKEIFIIQSLEYVKLLKSVVITKNLTIAQTNVLINPNLKTLLKKIFSNKIQ